MTTTTQVPDVLDYLFTTCQASPSLGGARPPVVVLDGPNITDDTLTEQLHLWIGYDPMNPGEPAATTDQNWPNLSQGRQLDEDAEIVCAAEAWSGTGTVKTVRDQCDAIVAAVALLLRGTVAGGGPGDTQMGGLVFWSRVTAGQWYQRPSQDGVAVMHVFKIMYKARLLTS
jgi:hypothetical protein